MTDKMRVRNSYLYRKPDGRPDFDIGTFMNRATDDEIRTLTGFARQINRNRYEVDIHFRGDAKNGLWATVHCDDQETETQIKACFKDWFDKQYDDYPLVFKRPLKYSVE